MKTNNWLNIEDQVPECKKGDKDFVGYLTSDTVALLMVGGLAGTYLDYGRRLVTFTPDGKEVVNWSAQATYSKGNIEHLILGWSPIPTVKTLCNPLKRLYKALLSFEKVDDKTTECTFINFDNEYFTVVLPVTLKQICQWLLGVNLQDAMPNLPSSQREFFLTGLTEEEWSELTNKKE